MCHTKRGQMKVLSLFDGMSCAQIALNKLGITDYTYYASELDKHAIKVTQANFPHTIQLGDVTNIKAATLPPIDLLIGGSPCQGFSFAGKQLNFDDPRSKLFFEYVRLLKECRPKYFLLENVRMKQEYQDIISEALGVAPIEINSSLASAQNRKRLYWTNLPGITQPTDKKLLIKDILEHSVSEEFYYSDKSIAYMHRGNEKWMQAGSCRKDRYTMHEHLKSFTLTANMHKGVPYNFFAERDCLELGHADNINGHAFLKRIYSVNAKSPTLTAICGGNQHRKIAEDGVCYRKLTPIECERLQTVPDNYTNHVSNTQRYRMLGNGFTVDIIAHILKEINASS